ncbi:Inherit from NOG: fg-gap repeat protein [Seminavis robusta]|uniref:Inherit from NOG: fg-gap repeat protein n=1 Tax=Seminavis robusta TaxID=568900 RepID=A0A9N8EIU4_9STRA|nr:Inherit from NOG: fg-gap repeat protein [Seminavis robusta]|eukprot:Sro1171_g248790.1 Inherit from NOG: fg-gap repeat protein (491) ;mRNA; f:794-2266
MLALLRVTFFASVLLTSSAAAVVVYDSDKRGVVASEQFARAIEIVDLRDLTTGVQYNDVLVGGSSGHIVLSERDSIGQNILFQPKRIPLYHPRSEAASLAVMQDTSSSNDKVDVVASLDRNEDDVAALVMIRDIKGSNATSPVLETLIARDEFRDSNINNTDARLMSVTSSDVKAVDLDDDGEVDLVACIAGNHTSGSEEGFLVVGRLDLESSKFVFETIYEGLGGTAFVEVADLDGDGDLDLVVSAPERNLILLFWNDGSGSFTSTVLDATAKAAGKMAVGDVDNDGRLDIVVGGETFLVAYFQEVEPTADKVSKQAASFAEGVTIWDIKDESRRCTSGCEVNKILIEDIDGDGSPDVAFTIEGVYELNVLFQGKTPRESLVNLDSPYGFSLGDLNLDGLVDIVGSAGNDYKVFYFLGEEVEATEQPTFMPSSPPAPQQETAAPEKTDLESNEPSGQPIQQDSTSFATATLHSALVVWCIAASTMFALK